MSERLPDGCFVVAIDGPAGAGKSTTSRRVAERLNLGYLDTGAIYRSVALAALERGIDVGDGRAVAQLALELDVSFTDGGTRVWCDGNDVSKEIREPRVGQAASQVSANPEVRSALASLQRGAARAPGIVAEGRDMGTVIFPDAGLKVFLSADAAERARRRTAELADRGTPAEPDAVLKEIGERDARDSSRSVAPLAAAPDALRIDSTQMTIEGVVDRIVNEAERRRSGN
jgi:cytidylate kinase